MYYETNRSKIKIIIRNIIVKVFGKNSYLLFSFKSKLIFSIKDVFNKIFLIFVFFLDKNKKIKQNINLINKLNFDKEKIELILNKNNKIFHDINLKWHHHLFANFSSDEQFQILEIGTYKGETTRFLVSIFPNSKVTSIDLSDKKFIQTDKSDSQRNVIEEIEDVTSLSSGYFEVPLGAQLLSDNLNSINFKELKRLSKKFIDTRTKNLNNSNINFVQIDSFQAIQTFEKNSFDFIWVDGNHIMPQVAFDIFQAYHLCKKNGYILCDDIIMKKHQKSSSSDDGYKIISNLSNNEFLETDYFNQTTEPKKMIGFDNFISLSKKLI